MTAVRWNVRVERPVDLPRLLRSLAILLLAVAFLIAAVRIQGRLEENTGVDACRAELVAVVSDASIQRDLADADLNRANGRANAADAALTLAIGAEVGIATPPDVAVPTLEEALRAVASASAEVAFATDRLSVAEDLLTEANDIRQVFEAAPSDGC